MGRDDWFKLGLSKLMRQEKISAVNAGFFLTLGITCRHLILTADGS